MPNKNTPPYLSMSPFTEDEYVRAVRRLGGVFRNNFNFSHLDDHIKTYEFKICTGCNSVGEGLSEIMKWSIPHYFPEYGFTHINERENARGVNTAAWQAVDSHERTCHFNFGIETDEPTGTCNIILIDAALEDQYIETVERLDGIWYTHFNIMEIGIHTEFENFEMCSGCHYDQWLIADVMKWSIPHYFPQYGFVNITERDTGVPPGANAAWVAEDRNNERCQFSFYVETISSTNRTTITLVCAGYSLGPEFDGEFENDQDDAPMPESDHDGENVQDDRTDHSHPHDNDEEESMEEHEQRLRAPRDEYERAVGDGHVSEVRPVNMELFHNVCLCTQVDNTQEKVNSVIKWSIPHYFPTYGFTHMTEHHDVRGEISRCWTAQSADGKLWVFCFHVKHDDDAGEADIYLVDAHCLGHIRLSR